MLRRATHLFRFLVLSIIPLLGCLAHAQDQQLSVAFDGGIGQVEVGGRYVGAEFHGSRPFPSRISFYYPVANSIDLSADYWRRRESRPLAVGVKIGNGEKRWLGMEPWSYVVSPHRVTFRHQEGEIEYSSTYEFCFNEPAMVFTFGIKNSSDRPVHVEIYTHIRMSLRTCQTYARKDSAWTDFDSSLKLLTAHFDDPETGSASVFLQNVGLMPRHWTSSAQELEVTDSGESRWISSISHLEERFFSPPEKGNPVAAFVYQKVIPPYDSLAIVQILGSCPRGEVKERAGRLLPSWQREISAFDDFVRWKAQQEAYFWTGDPWLDRSAVWARGILATNAHYLDGTIVPMPCPAEYNFFFTHDLLLTDLGAVRFDLERVKRDLLYVASLSKDNVIPHAYYWKDDGFKTEYATPDNWNHLWFILLTARYLRHSSDDLVGQVLYPLVTKSLEEVLQQRKQDNLMHAFRPDWWDIGWIEGARAYITILTVRALREYLYISSFLARDSEQLVKYENLAQQMQAALESRLWDEEADYLLNYNGATKDEHYYMGSLLAVVYHMLEPNMAGRLVETASTEIVDRRIGVRTVAPADFHTEESRKLYRFKGNEVGDQYSYANGGVWPHGNAWYALALKATGRVDEAIRFLKTTMTVDGIARSPNGHPAMYEYRYSNPDSPEFGKIDKPSFLWAGGMYLDALYELSGVSGNVWNVSFAGPLPSERDSCRFSLAFGSLKQVKIHGEGNRLRSFRIDGEVVPSLVIPLRAKMATHLDVEFGRPHNPYLERANAILHAASFSGKEKKLELEFSSFTGHRVAATVIAPSAAKEVLLNGNRVSDVTKRHQSDGLLELEIMFPGSDRKQKVELFF